MKCRPLANQCLTEPGGRFETHHFSIQQNHSLAELRDNMRLKKHLKLAVNTVVAPTSLVNAIRAGIRA